MKAFKLFFLSICTLFICQNMQARHLLGGNMTYECLGSDKYKFTLTVYRDAACVNCANFDQQAPIAVYKCPGNTNCESQNQSNTYLTLYTSAPEVSLFQTNVTTCMNGMEIFNGNSIEKGVYTFELDLPRNNDKYIINYQRCCRDAIVSNIENPESQGFTISAELSAFAQLNCNNSPIIHNLKATYQVCAGELAQINFFATDSDNDQIIYSICTPIQGGGEILSGPAYNSCLGAQPDPPCPPPYDNITFKSPFYHESPFSVSDGFDINPNTGVLQFTPNTIGRFLMAVCVDEFRSGILMNHSTHEFQVFSGISTISSSKDLTIANQVTVFPNPADDVLSLSFPENFKPESYSIKDLNGKSLIKKNWPNSNVIPVSGLATGVYFIYLKNKDYAFAKKFIVD